MAYERELVAWLAPLSADPDGYIKAVTAVLSRPLDISTDSDRVEAFLTARAAAYGGEGG